MEDYICAFCGITLEACKHWVQMCRKTGSKVCLECCMSCEDHIEWSGLWKCAYITPEQRKQEAAKKCSAKFNAEVMKISTVYRKERREAAKRRAIQEARARAKYKRENAGGSPLVK